MKKIKFYLIALAGGLFLTFNSCDSEDLTISQDEEIMSLQLDETINQSKSAKENNTSAQGHGIFNQTWGGIEYKRQFTFHANTMPDGSVEGNGALITTDGYLKVKFSIDCMIIDGNTATMSGYITKDEPEYVGNYIWFKVVDNGEGNNSNPDEISFLTYWSPSSYNGEDCNSSYDGVTYAIDSGNIQVK